MTGTECNGCGACCDPVITVIAPIQLADRTADAAIGHTQAEWMRAHLTPMRRKDGLAATTWQRGGGWSDVIEARDVLGGRVLLPVSLIPAHYYQCDVFDPVTRQCGDYAHRPAMCRDYPWHGDPPDPHKSLPPTCSYRADVGLPVAEIPVEWRTHP